jgi:hypothetical protein
MIQKDDRHTCYTNFSQLLTTVAHHTAHICNAELPVSLSTYYAGAEGIQCPNTSHLILEHTHTHTHTLKVWLFFSHPCNPYIPLSLSLLIPHYLASFTQWLHSAGHTRVLDWLNTVTACWERLSCHPHCRLSFKALQSWTTAPTAPFKLYPTSSSHYDRRRSGNYT